MVLLLWLVAAEMGVAQVAPAPRKASQAQVARQFLRSVLRGDYAAAYTRLAPEVRRAVSRERFEASARPLWRNGQRRGQDIELYKLGVRLAGPSSRLFYAFTFSSESATTPPPAVLEVTFRDTTARVVLGFGLRPGPATAPVRLAPAAKRNGLRR
ncbi:hypothetical protein BEN47_01570 [Hymenobacter lapidarius]|uniref:DUF3887 domain-containing protein n=1 Tax=Hymenobacter lapidarius TaxID=1908237 RepID=A0A1G1T5W2_9BACT|nr:hypothetical protein [Hymenobacter lapidarius]OGX86270.1 hypothetical protein BEN47_01570 [Hymenobacter lapidarius]